MSATRTKPASWRCSGPEPSETDSQDSVVGGAVLGGSLGGGSVGGGVGDESPTVKVAVTVAVSLDPKEMSASTVCGPSASEDMAKG